jgi:apolipoprotein N-acyltransferase
MTIWAIATGGLLAAAISAARTRHRGRLVPFAVAFAVTWLLPLAIHGAISLGAQTSTTASSSTLRVGIVQPCTSVEQKLDKRHWPTRWARLETLTAAAKAKGAELVIWPESARPGWIGWDDSAPFDDPEMRAVSKRTGVPILYGCEIARLRGGRPRALYNGAALVTPDDSEPAQWYGKRQLLPFVEGVPFAQWLGWDPLSAKSGTQSAGHLTLMGNFSPGPELTVFRLGSLRAGVLICYEGLYANLARDARAAGANVLAVLTNDAWWGRSVFPEWHARVGAVRAAEHRVPVVRAANSGVSSVIAPDGTMLARQELDERDVLVAEVPLHDPPPTLYGRTGGAWDTALGLVPVLLLLASVFFGRSRAPKPARTAAPAQAPPPHRIKRA